MKRFLFPQVLLVLCACRHASPSAGATPSTPRLTAPEAPVYAVVHGKPPDPLVASQVKGLPWDEALSGAAGALAMEDVAHGIAPTDWTVRWAALRAGYAYPVQLVGTEQVAADALPTTLVARLAELSKGDIGLARVRGTEVDLWIALAGSPVIRLAPFYRSVGVGESIAIAPENGSAHPEVDVEVASPSGLYGHKALASGFHQTLTEAGEWWFQMSVPGRTLAAFPVYAGIIPPKDVPLQDGLSSTDVGAAADPDTAWRLVVAFRRLFDWPLSDRDPILDAAARRALQSAPGSSKPLLPGAPGACRTSVRCTTTGPEGVVGCVRAWYVDASDRAELLQPSCTLAGLALAADASGLHLDVELGSP
jgi:hypothetical protein